MSSKEKAKELVKKYYTLQHKTIICSDGYAKECALICVNEIINSSKEYFKNTTYDGYWSEVLTEIESL